MVNRLVPAVLALSILTSGCALRRTPSSRTAGSPAPPEASRSAAGTSTIAEASVRAHMEFLAGDALNGRGSGTRDEWIAASYAAAHMRRLGLEPLGTGGDGFVQAIAIQRNELTSMPILTAGSRRFSHGKEIVVQALGAPRVSGRLQKWTAGATVAPDAVVLLPDPVPANLPSLGRAIVLSPQVPLARQRWQVLSARSPRVPPQIGSTTSTSGTMVYLDPQAYASMAAAADGDLVTIEAESKQGPRTQTWNAVGQLRGSAGAASPVILLSAHIDHLGSPDKPGATGDTIYNGADDDASGSVAVLELMEALAKGQRPKRTIVFALFGSEEGGGIGSRFFADQPTVPLDRIAANLQFEMIGRPDPKVPPHTLWLTGYDRSTLGPELTKRGAKLIQDPHPEQNFFERSDNIQFARRGVVAHTVSSYGLHGEYHTPADEIRQIDFPHMTDSIRSMLEPIRWLANSDFTPTWVAGRKP